MGIGAQFAHQSPSAIRMPLFCANPRDSSKVIISFMVTSLFVFTRIISNPLSNVFQKKLTGNSARPVFIILVTYIREKNVVRRLVGASIMMVGAIFIVVFEKNS